MGLLINLAVSFLVKDIKLANLRLLGYWGYWELEYLLLGSFDFPIIVPNVAIYHFNKS